MALHFERFSAWDPSVYLCHYAPFQTVLPSDHSSIDVMSWLTAHVQGGNAPNTMLRVHHKPAPVWAWFSRPSMDLPSLFAGTRGEKRGKKKKVTYATSPTNVRVPNHPGYNMFCNIAVTLLQVNEYIAHEFPGLPSIVPV